MAEILDKEIITKILGVDIKVITDSGVEKVISLKNFVHQKDSYISVYKDELENPRYNMNIHIEADGYGVEVIE